MRLWLMTKTLFCSQIFIWSIRLCSSLNFGYTSMPSHLSHLISDSSCSLDGLTCFVCFFLVQWGRCMQATFVLISCYCTFLLLWLVLSLPPQRYSRGLGEKKNPYIFHTFQRWAFKLFSYSYCSTRHHQTTRQQFTTEWQNVTDGSCRTPETDNGEYN